MIRFCACGKPIWVEFQGQGWEPSFFLCEQYRKGEKVIACPHCKKILDINELR